MRAFTELDNNKQGILCLIGAVIFLTFSDSIIKWLSDTYALHEITLLRAIFALPIVFVIVRLEGGMGTLKTRRPALHLFRGMLMVLANMFFFLGLSVMPLAQVVALFFTAPLFICLLARPILGERVGAWRWVAIFAGMGGVIIMVRPDAGSFSWAGILPVLAAFTYALLQMLTRILGLRDSAGTMTLYMQIAFILVSLISGILIGGGRFDTFDEPALSFLFRAWRLPDLQDFGLLAICGLIVALGAYLLSQSYRLAQASVVAPFEYTSLPFALLVGYLIWGDLPGLKQFLGSLIIVGSGLIVVFAESRLKKQAGIIAPG